MHPKSLLRGAHAYLSPTAALGGLSAAHAASQPVGVPHSIAEIVAHMAFWQEWFLDRCAGKAVPSPASASLGWPKVNSGDWEAVRERFEAAFNRALALADDSTRVAQPIAPSIEVDLISSSGACPRTAPPGARRKALITADASAPGGAPRSRPPARRL